MATVERRRVVAYLGELWPSEQSGDVVMPTQTRQAHHAGTVRLRCDSSRSARPSFTAALWVRRPRWRRRAFLRRKSVVMPIAA
jgi:hypothetical protein